MTIREMQITYKQRIAADASLLFVALIWGLAFVAQRYAAPRVGVFLFNGLRFWLGALVLLPFLVAKRRPTGRKHRLNRDLISLVILAGILLGAGAAFQQAGLKFTTAGNAGFITGLYVVIIPFILAVGFKQKPGFITWFSAILATAGLFLLSTFGSLQLNIGDSLELAGAFFWALHIILVAWLVVYMDVIHLAVGQYFVCGILSVLISIFFENISLSDMAGAWWAILFTGLISVGVGYTLLAKSQKVAPPAHAAIILSTEAVFAAFFGWILLGESLTGIQILGASIMLLGMILAQTHNYSHSQTKVA